MLLILFLIFIFYKIADIVEQKSKYEQGNSRSINRFILQRTVLYIAKAHLHDICGNGFY